MHRETLSRSLLYSHNLMGKSMTTFCSKGSISVTGTPVIVGSWAMNRQPLTSSARCYHLDKPAGTIMKPAVNERKIKDLDSFRVSEDNSSHQMSPSQSKVQKQLNIKAKDILSVPDPPLKSSTSESLSPEIDNTSITSRSLIDSKILSARSIEELLNLSAESDLTLKHACYIISRMGHLAHKVSESRKILEISKDTRFVRIFNLIHRGNHAQFPHTLLQALNGLQKLGLETSDEVTRLLEQELSWSMRRCHLRFLAKSVRILYDNKLENKVPSDDKEKTVLQLALQVLHRRWIEAISGSDFISLFQIIELLDDDTKVRLEERASDVAYQFTPNEMMKLFIVLGTKKRRPTPLLRSLAFHYCKSEQKSTAKDVIEFIYALNELTFADPILMNRLCTEVSEEISNIKNVSLISSLLTSLGQMRYKQKEILLAVDDWITAHTRDLRAFDYAAWLQAAAALNHDSENLRGFCQTAQQILLQSTVASPTEWVNIVHSFVILNHVKPDMLSSVLSSTFIDSIEKLGLKSHRHKHKLLNLNFIASQTKDYKGELISDDKIKQWSAALVNSSDNKLSKLLVDTLGNFLPAAKYVEPSQQLDCGVFVDAMLYVDSNKQPMTLEAAKSKPSSSQRVAIVVEGYPAMCLGLKHPTGSSMLNVRLLEAQNFVVITVPYTEFGYEKLVRRVQYLEQKLKSISLDEKSLPVTNA